MIYTIGFYIPVVILTLAIWQLWLIRPEFYIFLIGYLASEIANELLKIWIKEPRPKKSVDITGPHLYGMPSGHAQSTTFIITFVYLLFRHIEWLYMTIPLWILTCFQRWMTQMHSPEQLVAGSAVGAILGYLTYMTTT